MVDASALVLAVAGKDAAARALGDRLGRIRVHAPHLVDAECGNVLRRHERAGLLSAEEAGAARAAAALLVDERYPHLSPLADAAWVLRHNLSYYDALYAALAAGLRIPLLTADERLAHAPGLPCEIDLFAHQDNHP